MTLQERTPISPDHMYEELPLYKITLSGVAGESIDHAVFMSSNVEVYVIDAFIQRGSPIVFYAHLEDSQAVLLAQTDGVDCVRAREDWSI